MGAHLKFQRYYRLLQRTMRHFRSKRFGEFRQRVPISRSDKILDLGGSPYFWEGTGLESQVTILNITLPPHQPAPYRWLRGDACNLKEIEDQSYDLVFSNSVIEHVGTLERQQQMAKEVQRVGIRYWVQTPNRHFPLEPHYMFPFFQYMPLSAKSLVARHWPFSHGWQHNQAMKEVATIRLLTEREIQRLFPDATIWREKALGLTKSVIAYRA